MPSAATQPSLTLGELCDDLTAERKDLFKLLHPLDAPSWQLETPAPGWAIQDQVTHLAWFDDAARQAIREPDRFLAHRATALVQIDTFTDSIAHEHRQLSPAVTLSWLTDSGAELVAAAKKHDPAARVPWYGPDMTIMSSVTARLMETWAHSQDIADALHTTRTPTDRLRHVAYLGWRAIPNSYRARGRPVPGEAIRVELEQWTWGPPDAVNVVRGPAIDFCLVVTQRRHPADTALIAQGPVAAEWLQIAQAFAGPPGAGRTPGQFT